MLWIFLFLLAGCAPLVTNTPPAPPEVLSLQMSPTLRVYADRVQQCALKYPQFAVTLAEIPANALDLTAADLTLQLESPSTDFSGYATQIGTEQIIIVGGSAVPQSQLGVADLRALYTAANPDYQIWVYPHSSELDAIFNQTVLAGIPASPNAWIAPTPETIIAAIEQNPLALGYLPSSWLRDESYNIPVTAELATLFEIPVLALMDQEPRGSVRAFLGCLEEILGE